MRRITDAMDSPDKLIGVREAIVGKENTMVTLTIRQPTGATKEVKVLRQRGVVPDLDGSTEDQEPIGVGLKLTTDDYNRIIIRYFAFSSSRNLASGHVDICLLEPASTPQSLLKPPCCFVTFLTLPVLVHQAIICWGVCGCQRTPGGGRRSGHG